MTYNRELSQFGYFVDVNDFSKQITLDSSVTINGNLTIGDISISSGIVTANTGIITYYGDGSKLLNVSYWKPNISGIFTTSNVSIYGNLIVGDISISSGIITANTGIVTYYGDGSKLVGIASYWSKNSSSVFTIDNVGIGTTTASSKLSVRSTPDDSSWVLEYDSDPFDKSNQENYASGIGIGSTGSIYLCGHVYYGEYGVVAKFSDSGQILWQNIYEYNTTGTFLILDKNSDTIYAGITTGGDIEQTSFWYTNIVKLDSDGNTIWKKLIPVKGLIPHDIALDSSSNVYILLQDYYISKLDFIKLDSNGNILTQKSINNAPSEFSSIITDSTNNVYVSYSTGIVKFNSSGSDLWKISLSNTDKIDIHSITVDSSNNLYAAGYDNSGSTKLGVVIKFNSSNGNIIWQKNINALDSVRFSKIGSIKIGPDDKIYVCGEIDGNNDHIALFYAKLDDLGNLIYLRLLDNTSENILYSPDENDYYLNESTYGNRLIDILNDHVVVTGTVEKLDNTILYKVCNDDLTTKMYGDFHTVEDLPCSLQISTFTTSVSSVSISNTSYTLNNSNLQQLSLNNLPNHDIPGTYPYTLSVPQTIPTVKFYEPFIYSINSNNVIKTDILDTSKLYLNHLPFNNSNGILHNFSVGFGAGEVDNTYSCSGCENNFLGTLSGAFSNGSNNNFLGNSSGSNGCNEYSNFLGYYAGYLSKGCNNNFFGSFSGTGNNEGSHNNFFGVETGSNSNTGCYNNFFGYHAGRNNTSGSINNFIGLDAGLCNTSGFENNFIGYAAGRYNICGNNNVFVGSDAGYYNECGSYNNFFGWRSGYYNTTGQCNNFIGFCAGAGNTNGYRNNFFGESAGECNFSGNTNNAIGYFAFLTGGGTENNAIGYCALSNNDSGSYNIALGSESGSANLTGCYNIYVGNTAGNYNQTGSRNTFFGGYVGLSTSSDYKVILGQANSAINRFDSPDTSKSKQFAVGINSTGTAEYWLVGNENMNVGIGTTNPTTKLHVEGGIVGVLTPGTFTFISGSAGLDFALQIPSWAKRINIIPNGITGTSPLLRVGTSLGIYTTGYSGPSASGILFQYTTLSDPASGIITLIKVPGQNQWVASGAVTRANGSPVYPISGSSPNLLNLPLTTLRIQPSSGVFTGGSISYYYEG